jgi:NDP-sugar pyrophosphorylase family protein
VSTELTRSELLPVCVAGDVVLETGYLARVVEAFDPARQAASVAVRQVAGSTGFDAVDIEDGTGVGVRTGSDDLTVPTAGAVASTPALLDHASTLHPPREALVDALDSLVAAGGPVHAEAGFWTAVASAEDVLDANRVLLDRRVDPRLRGLCESPGIPPEAGFASWSALLFNEDPSGRGVSPARQRATVHREVNPWGCPGAYHADV